MNKIKASHLWITIILFFLSTLLIACSDGNPSSDKNNSTIVEVETSNPKIEETSEALNSQGEKLNEDYASGGLGLSTPAWELIHGSGTENDNGVFITYSDDEDKRYQVISWGVVELIDVQLKKPVDWDTATSYAKDLSPQDRILLESFTSQSGRWVDVYESPSLKERLPDDYFPIDNQSIFIVSYLNIDDRIHGIIIATPSEMDLIGSSFEDQLHLIGD